MKGIQSLKSRGGAITPFRVECDFRITGINLLPDINPEIAAREEYSHFAGDLKAIKPLRRWWEDD